MLKDSRNKVEVRQKKLWTIQDLQTLRHLKVLTFKSPDPRIKKKCITKSFSQKVGPRPPVGLP